MKSNLVDTFSIEAINHFNAINSGNSKKANQAHKTIYKIFHELQDHNLLDDLKVLFESTSPAIRLWSATCLLVKFPKEASQVLMNLKNDSSSGVSLDAKYVLEEWQNGTFEF